MGQHKDLTGTNLHEPKGFSALTGGASDVGKVTASDGAGGSLARNLKHSEIIDKFEHYGQQLISGNTTAIAVTAATDTTLGTSGDYIQVVGIFDTVPIGLNNGITQQTNQLTITQAGVYRIEIYANTFTDTTTVVSAFRFAINGTVGVARQPKHLMKTAGDINNAAAHGFIQLAAADVITLFVACDKSCDLTIEDGVFELHMIRAL